MHKGSGVPLLAGYAVHFCGVPMSVGYAVHFCGVFAAAQKLLLVNHSASTLKSANHRPNTLRQRFKHLNHQMNMIRHHLLCKHLQGKPLRSVKLRQATQNLIYTIAKGVKLNESPFRTLALQCSKKRKAPLNGEGKMIDGTTTIVPPVFTVVPCSVYCTPNSLSFSLRLLHIEKLCEGTTKK